MWSWIADAILVSVCLAALILSIRRLKDRGYATEINVVWYAFSFVFVIRSAVDAAALVGGYDSPTAFLEIELGIPSAYTLRLHEWLTNLPEELAAVAAIVIVTIAPQLLTYLLAGLFGCAKSPPFVWYFEKFAAWSLIKFMAALAGIRLEETLSPRSGWSGWRLTVRDWPSVDLYMTGLAAALIILMLAFVFAYGQTRAVAIAEGNLEGPRPGKLLAKLHRFFTRNLPEKLDRQMQGHTCGP